MASVHSLSSGKEPLTENVEVGEEMGNQTSRRPCQNSLPAGVFAWELYSFSSVEGQVEEVGDLPGTQWKRRGNTSQAPAQGAAVALRDALSSPSLTIARKES